jgi:hypothetical protein
VPVGPLPLALPEMTIRTSTDEGARAVDGNRDLATTLFFYRECPPPRITPHPGRFFLVSRRATFFTSVFSKIRFTGIGVPMRESNPATLSRIKYGINPGIGGDFYSIPALRCVRNQKWEIHTYT